MKSLADRLASKMTEAEKRHGRDVIRLTMHPNRIIDLFADKYSYIHMRRSFDGKGINRFLSVKIENKPDLPSNLIYVLGYCDCSILWITGKQPRECTVTFDNRTRKCVKCNGTQFMIIGRLITDRAEFADVKRAKWPKGITVPPPRYDR